MAVEDAPDRKYSVFISSTFEDLKEKRQNIITSILRTGNIPISMEISFFPGERRDPDFFANNIDRCDIFVIMLHTFFGSKIDGKRSYTEYEYDTAKDKEKPIIAFVPNSEFLKSNNCDNEQKVFIEKVKTGTLLVHMYESKDEIDKELQNLINKAVISLMNSQTGGWVRSEHYDRLRKFSNLPTSMISNAVTRDIFTVLSGMEKFYAKLNIDESEKKSISKYVCRLLMAGIISKLDNMYIDGSTTTLWMCLELVAYFDRFNFDNNDRSINIYTNGIFNILYLTTAKIRHGVKNIQLQPSNPSFSDDYGVVWGHAKSGPPGNAYEYDQHNFEYSDAVISRTNIYLETFKKEVKGNTVILSSFTGYDFNNMTCGPYVKSFNTLIEKRALYRSQSPLILIFDGKKWTDGAGKRFPIFRPEEWKALLRDYPVLIASVTLIEDKHNIILKHFEDLGLKSESEVSHDYPPNIIFQSLHFNRMFTERLELPALRARFANP